MLVFNTVSRHETVDIFPPGCHILIKPERQVQLALTVQIRLDQLGFLIADIVLGSDNEQHLGIIRNFALTQQVQVRHFVVLAFEPAAPRIHLIQRNFVMSGQKIHFAFFLAVQIYERLGQLLFSAELILSLLLARKKHIVIVDRFFLRTFLHHQSP
ncbi:Uncharacterised protein [Mycobacterium tuberculosis]|nr:Uncharacterised protein [Mycobacterium tuberculosis]